MAIDTTWRLGVSADNTPILATRRQGPEPERDKPILVGVRGKWYDVSKYVAVHPGGDILLEYADRDATASFVAYHDDRVLKHWKPVGTYAFDAAAPDGDAFAGAHLRLAEEFERLGFFRTSRVWVGWMLLRAAGSNICLIAAVPGTAGCWWSGLVAHTASCASLICRSASSLTCERGPRPVEL